ncbi:MAG: hypothetical protein KC766_33190 [Myxococcales bacterium]|nr:hypothetical protein [Myxococcales bacterium]
MKKRNPSSDFVREFTESMPRDYLQQHTHEEVVRHARVAAARRSELVRVEVDSGEHHTGNVYFVADDRAGLLARASSALSTLNLSIDDGEIWIRNTPTGRQETLGVFQVHAEDGGEVDTQRAGEIQELLTALLEGRLDSPSKANRAATPGAETRVRFVESADGGLNVLEVETRDRSGLLSALANALFEKNVQIVEAQVRTRDGEVHDRFSVVELDGSPIDSSRRLDIQVAVLTAVDTAQR